MNLKKSIIIGASVLALSPVIAATFSSRSVYASEVETELNTDIENSSNFFIDDDGKVYLNNEEVAHIEEVKPSQEILDKQDLIDNGKTALSARGVTSWKLFNRKYYKLSDIRTAQGLAFSLLGFLPLNYASSAALGAVGLYQTLSSMGKDEVYVKLEQFTDGSNARIRNIIYYYSDANYSNKIKQVEIVQRL